MAGELQRVDRRVAAHEADDRALDGRVEPDALDQLQIDARARKSRCRR